MPFCPFAQLGGRNGTKLARAAFSAILKFSDALFEFMCFAEDVQKQSEKHSQIENEDQRMKEIIKEYRSSSNEGFQNMLKIWEQAAQMRKWISGLKLELVEKIKAEVEEKMRAEILEANPSGEQSSDFTDEQKKAIEKSTNELLDQRINEKFEDVINKAKFLIKLAIPQAFIDFKGRETIKDVKTGILGRLGK